MTACCASRRAIGRGGPRQPNAVADDTVALPFIACRVDQFDDAIPFVGEVDGCQDREPALIEITSEELRRERARVPADHDLRQALES